jgi:hypothetical protein
MAEGEDKAPGGDGEDPRICVEAELEQANVIYLTDRLRGSIEALKAIADYLDKTGVRLRAPFVELMAGLEDLAEGFPPKWLVSKNSRGGNRKGREERAFQARILGTVEFLKTIGLTQKKAQEKVSQALDLTKKTVEHIDQRLKGFEGFDVENIVVAYKKSLMERTLGSPPEQAENFVCDLLKDAARARRPLPTLPGRSGEQGRGRGKNGATH